MTNLLCLFCRDKNSFLKRKNANEQSGTKKKFKKSENAVAQLAKSLTKKKKKKAKVGD